MTGKIAQGTKKATVKLLAPIAVNNKNKVICVILFFLNNRQHISNGKRNYKNIKIIIRLKL